MLFAQSALLTRSVLKLLLLSKLPPTEKSALLNNFPSTNSLKLFREKQGRAVGVVAGATRAFGRRTQGVWGRAPQPPEVSSAVIKP